MVVTLIGRRRCDVISRVFDDEEDGDDDDDDEDASDSSRRIRRGVSFLLGSSASDGVDDVEKSLTFSLSVPMMLVFVAMTKISLCDPYRESNLRRLPEM